MVPMILLMLMQVPSPEPKEDVTQPTPNPAPFAASIRASALEVKPGDAVTFVCSARTAVGMGVSRSPDEIKLETPLGRPVKKKMLRGEREGDTFTVHVKPEAPPGSFSVKCVWWGTPAVESKPLIVEVKP